MYRIQKESFQKQKNKFMKKIVIRMSELNLVKFWKNFNLEMNGKKKWQMKPNYGFIDVFEYYIEKITYLIVKVNLGNR